MMKVLKLVIVILLLAQLPFIYSVWQSYQLNRYFTGFHREDKQDSPPFQDIRGGIHAHTAAGGHSLGTYPEIIQAAKQAGYRYLFITEHPRTPALFTPVEDPDLVLIYGSEEQLTPSCRVLLSPDGKLKFLTHFDGSEVPDEVRGLEIFNMHECAKGQNTWYIWGQFFYHRFFFPQLFFFHLWKLNPQSFARWDKALSQRHLTGIAGNDAHQNLGLVLQTASGQELLSMLVDPYLENFRFVTTHLLLPQQVEVSEESLLNALETGAAYVAFERIANPTGFSFHAEQDNRIFPMGSEVRAGAQLVLQSPVRARFRLIHNGEPYKEFEGHRVVWQTNRPGVYRLEVFPLQPPSMIEGKPWIISNPIFVRGTAP